MVDVLGIAATGPMAILGRLLAAGVAVLTLDDPSYPDRLRRIEEPPPVLFVRGRIGALDPRRAVAIVGTRRPTEAGRRIAARLADAFARVETTTVSGLAVGIDGSAHAAAVAAGWPTVAVLGSGHERLFPRAHRRLADAILDGDGAIVSELPPDTSPTPGTFPRRNRVISGLAQATVVMTGARRQGADHRRWALEQGGTFLVRLDRRTGLGGCRRSCAVRGRGPDRGRRGRAARRSRARRTGKGGRTGRTRSPHGGDDGLSVAQAQIARATAGATTVDDLASRSGLPVSTVLGTLTLLEIRGLVVGAYGRYRTSGVLAAAPQGLL
jgi:DNA processing protein